jgi:ribonucleotide monophosphatase NagD (HAD superfamily)
MGIGPGAVAARYEELGGRVVYFGKPHPQIYRHCLELLPERDSSRVVAVGDSLKTDIAGAHTSGLDNILLGSGIHARECAQVPEHTEILAELCRAETIYPKMLARGFVW